MPRQRKTVIVFDVDDYRVTFELETSYGSFGDWDTTVSPPLSIVHLDDDRVIDWASLSPEQQKRIADACWSEAYDELERIRDRVEEPED